MDARSHVQRLDGQPDGLDLDHRSRSRSQPPHSLASAAGQVTTTCTAPRRTSMRMSLAGAGASAGAGNCTGTNPLTAGLGVAPGNAFGTSIGSGLRGWISASRTQRRNRFALMRKQYADYVARDRNRAATDPVACQRLADRSAVLAAMAARSRELLEGGRLVVERRDNEVQFLLDTVKNDRMLLAFP